MKKKTRLILGVVCLFAVIAATLLFLCREPILRAAGRFMACEGCGSMEAVADAVVLEGTEYISRGMIVKGLEIRSSGRAKRVVVVLHSIAPNRRPFGINGDYPDSVRRGLKRLGLEDSAFTVIVTHIHSPITLVSAKGAVETLSREGVRSVILVSQGFHARRSFLVYQYLAAPLHIKVYPVACFDAYRLHNWWNEERAPRDFMEEIQKFAFYLVRGYIPFRFSYP